MDNMKSRCWHFPPPLARGISLPLLAVGQCSAFHPRTRGEFPRTRPMSRPWDFSPPHSRGSCKWPPDAIEPFPLPLKRDSHRARNEFYPYSPLPRERGTVCRMDQISRRHFFTPARTRDSFYPRVSREFASSDDGDKLPGFSTPARGGGVLTSGPHRRHLAFSHPPARAGQSLAPPAYQSSQRHFGVPPQLWKKSPSSARKIARLITAARA